MIHSTMEAKNPSSSSSSIRGRRNVGNLSLNLEKITHHNITTSPKSSTSSSSATSSQTSAKGLKRTLVLQPIDTSVYHNHLNSVTPSSAHPLSAGSDLNGMHNMNDPYRNAPVQILPWLYLGSEKNASSEEVLMQNGIVHILNVGKECRNHFKAYGVHSAALSTESLALTDNGSNNSAPVSPIYNPLNLNHNGHHIAYPASAGTGAHNNNTLNNYKSGFSSSRKRVSDNAADSPNLISDTTSSISNTIDTHIRVLKSPRTMADILAMEFETLSSSSTSSQQHPPPESKIDLENFHPPQYKKFAWSHNQDNIRQCFDEAFDIIDSVKTNQDGKAVLIHCKQGVSRSATLVIAYIMKTLNLNMSDAYNYVRDKSPSISPNLALIYQLVEFEKELGLPSSGTQDQNETPQQDSTFPLQRLQSSNSRTRALDTVCE